MNSVKILHAVRSAITAIAELLVTHIYWMASFNLSSKIHSQLLRCINSARILYVL